MKKIDFSKMEICTGISHELCVVRDIREDFADTMFKNMIGLPALALALKIYNSNGEEEYDDKEVKIIKACAENFTSPNVIDAIYEKIK